MPAPAKKPPSLSAFDEKGARPTGAELRRVLGAAAPVWDELVAHVKHAYSPAEQHWNFAGPKYGWSVKLKRADRVILYLIPQAGRFLVGIVLGDKAVSAAKTADLPADVVNALAQAPRYGEGTGLRLPVFDRGQLSAIHTLAALKMARLSPRARQSSEP